MAFRHSASTAQFQERPAAALTGSTAVCRPSFQLMFRSDRLRSDDLYFKEASKRAFEQLKEVVAPFVAHGDANETDTRLLMAWSVVHGFATLVNEGHLMHFQHGRRPQRLRISWAAN